MSTANQPTVTCKLDDGTGTFPTDVSSRVSLSNISWDGYGRADESTTASAATLNIDLRNDDGAFTNGTIAIAKGRLIRLTLHTGATTRNCFTGRIDTLTQGWVGAPGKRSVMSVSAVDAFSELTRRPIRSMLEQEILLDAPTAYYTLGEAEGSTSAGDTSGNGENPLTITGAGLPVVFGSGTGPVDGLTAVQFNYDGVTTSQYLSASSAKGGFTTGGSWSLEGFMNWTGTAGSMVLQLTNGINEVDIVSAGTVSFILGSSHSTSGVSTNATHHFVMTFDGANLLGYVDGVLAVTAVAVLSAPLSTLNVGVAVGSGTISHVAVYDGIVLSAGRVASHAAVLTGFVETTDARLTRIASYAGITPTTVTPSGQIMGAQQTSGQSVFDALQAVADAEGGVLFVDGSGTLTMQGRYYRSLKTTATLALTGKALEPASTSVVDDTQQTINQVTATRTGGAEQVAQDQASIDDNGVFPASLDLAVDTDANALYHAQWVVAKHADPGPRLPSLVFTNLLTSPHAADILALEIGDRISLSAMPSQTTTALGDVVIEGWSMSIAIDGDSAEWTMTANLLPWELFRVFILNDTTYGRLDATANNPLGY